MASLAPALAPPPVVGPLPTGFGLGPGREVTEPTMATSRLSCPLLPLPVGQSPCSLRRLNVVLTRRSLPLPALFRLPLDADPRQAPQRDPQVQDKTGVAYRTLPVDGDDSDTTHLPQTHHHHSKTGGTTTRRPRYGRQGRLGCRTSRYVVETDSARRWRGGWSHFRLGRRLAGQLSDWSWFLWKKGLLVTSLELSVRPSWPMLISLAWFRPQPIPHRPSATTLLRASAHLASRTPDTRARTATRRAYIIPSNQLCSRCSDWD
ncbi:hypothetical protein FB45DRAFT_558785 [Roridomyces roridus]|uniref:Uncharacterized protein n=1 Tax=Roridomyces roridus TaxID=1738132 RepID=A0AAD7BUU6_9AGAR|nr:hypothetical protein FB45DRAFT_558785 [Roridomyces roridus]